MTDLSVDIGHVTVEGESPRPSAGRGLDSAIGAALEQMVARRGMPNAASGEDRSIPMRSVDVPYGASDRDIAEAIARAIYGAVDGWR